MKDELVTFDTAKLAKEKGFDEIVYGRYMFNPNQLESSEKAHKNTWDENYLAAPTQSLLQRWLRDEKNLWVGVDHYKNRTYTAHISDECDNSKSDELFGNIYYSYEQALENGLQEALKLI
tara:strand:+ start:112 stop:471 length:360 start_codon:yes stop_codon:yes gene_type:complete